MKRFTATEKWDKPWYRKLPPRLKCLWDYLCERCDHAGVIDPDWEAISFTIGEEVTASDLALMNGNVVPLNGGNKLWLPGFVPFQYGKLNLSDIPDWCPLPEDTPCRENGVWVKAIPEVTICCCCGKSITEGKKYGEVYWCGSCLKRHNKADPLEASLHPEGDLEDQL